VPHFNALHRHPSAAPWLPQTDSWFWHKPAFSGWLGNGHQGHWWPVSDWYGPWPGHHDHRAPEVAEGQEFLVAPEELENGFVLGKVSAEDNIGVAEFRLGAGNPDTDGDGTPAFAIAADGTLAIADLDDFDFGVLGAIDLTVTAHDAAGNASSPETVTVTQASDPLVPSNTPFNYNLGINYESWEDGRTGYSITADLDQITQYFKLIKTYHAAAVGTADPTTPVIDPTQAQVISYITGTADAELVMGTNNSALAQGGFGTPWEAGLMTDKAYTDQWVQMLIDAFGSAANVESHLRAILLGNEVDANGVPPGDPLFDTYIGWIETSFDNLKASLAEAGLGDIPISTTIANYGATNAVAVQVTQYIHDNWDADWNGGTSFVFFNQYTQNGGQSTDFGQVESYFDTVQSQVPAGLEVFIGETGYSSYYGAANQADVYQQLFDWLDGQESADGKTVPAFPFVAFDRPSFDTTPTPQEADFGIFGEDANSQPTGLKPDLAGLIPSWSETPINTLENDGETLLGGATKDIFAVEAGSGEIDGGDSDHDLLVLNGDLEDFTFSFANGKHGWFGGGFDKLDDMAVTIRSGGGAIDVDVRHVEYFQFDDQLVQFDDLPSGCHGHGMAHDFFGW
jgi:hypothetical protein